MPKFVASIDQGTTSTRCMIFNRTGEVIGVYQKEHQVVWQDTRTKDICDDLARQGGVDRFRSKVGLPLATYFSGPKIKWILDNVEGVRVAAEQGNAIFGNIDAWEIWWLTGGPQGGVHVTDVTNASRTMLMNLTSLDWDDEILNDLDICQSQ